MSEEIYNTVFRQNWYYSYHNLIFKTWIFKKVQIKINRNKYIFKLKLGFYSFWFLVLNTNFENSIIPGVSRGPTKNLGPISSAVLTYMGYIQTDTQTDKQSIYIKRDRTPFWKNAKKKFIFFLFLKCHEGKWEGLIRKEFIT